MKLIKLLILRYKRYKLNQAMCNTTCIDERCKLNWEYVSVDLEYRKLKGIL